MGDILVDGIWECYSLEDPYDGGANKANKNAIPEGMYPIIITRSIRFKRDMPLICDVPDRQGIRIHTGNTADDTSGCILVGQSCEADFVGHSKSAFNVLFAKIKTALLAKTEVWIDINHEGIFPGEKNNGYEQGIEKHSTFR